jgi:sulfate adenylyltransferase
MRLSNGLVWPIPVALDVPSDFAKDLKPGQIITLKFNDQAIAVMQLEDVYTYDKKYEVKQIYNSESPEHPGVKLVENQGDHYIGGKVFVKQGAFDDGEFSKDNITPKAAREHFHKKGWETVVAFQTRNPLHRAHEHLLKTALESTDGLFLNPLVGSTKSDDVPPAVRMKTYKIMLDKYFNPDRVIFSTFPAAMRYAGPKEAILHAIARQNYGCTHMIVGRDHAGVGNFYGPYDAQLIFTHLKPDDLNIKVVKFENAFYCKSTGTMATLKTCPADSEKIELSGTKVRQILRDGGQLPEEISRQEVAAILSEHYKNHKEPK